ncbi:MAG: tetratricopeptide repeat protein [Candidatus Thorarchaeota archaeon]
MSVQAASEGIRTPFGLDYRVLGAASFIILIVGVILAWVVGHLGIFDPGIVISLTMFIVMIMVCCTSMMVIQQFAARIPEYGEMEIRFEEGMEHYKNREWEEALKIFQEQMGPDLNHKRALFYGAKCCKNLDDYEGVKKYIRRYLELSPKDKDAWEMLAGAHKKLFEYEEAEDAMEKASRL